MSARNEIVAGVNASGSVKRAQSGRWPAGASSAVVADAHHEPLVVPGVVADVEAGEQVPAVVGRADLGHRLELAVESVGPGRRGGADRAEDQLSVDAGAHLHLADPVAGGHDLHLGPDHVADAR